jgi:hypothetical protein
VGGDDIMFKGFREGMTFNGENGKFFILVLVIGLLFCSGKFPKTAHSYFGGGYFNGIWNSPFVMPNFNNTNFFNILPFLILVLVLTTVHSAHMVHFRVIIIVIIWDLIQVMEFLQDMVDFQIAIILVLGPIMVNSEIMVVFRVPIFLDLDITMGAFSPVVSEGHFSGHNGIIIDP